MFWLKRILLSSSITRSPFNCYFAESRMWLRHFADQSPQFEQMEHPKYSCFICYCCGCLVPSIWGFCLMMMLLYARGGNTCGTLALHTAYSRVNHEAECLSQVGPTLAHIAQCQPREKAAETFVSRVSRLSECQFLVSSVCPSLALSLVLYVGHATNLGAALCLFFIQWSWLSLQKEVQLSCNPNKCTHQLARVPLHLLSLLLLLFMLMLMSTKFNKQVNIRINSPQQLTINIYTPDILTLVSLALATQIAKQTK